MGYEFNDSITFALAGRNQLVMSFTQGAASLALGYVL